MRNIKKLQQVIAWAEQIEIDEQLIEEFQIPSPIVKQEAEVKRIKDKQRVTKQGPVIRKQH